MSPHIRFRIGKLAVEAGGMGIRIAPRITIPDGIHIWWGETGIHLYWHRSPWQGRIVRDNERHINAHFQP